MNGIAMGINVEIFVWTYVLISPEGIAYTHHMVIMFNHLGNCWIAFQSSHSTLHSHQLCMGFQYLYIFTNTRYYLSSVYNPPGGYEVVSHCGFACL